MVKHFITIIAMSFELVITIPEGTDSLFSFWVLHLRNTWAAERRVLDVRAFSAVAFSLIDSASHPSASFWALASLIAVFFDTRSSDTSIIASLLRREDAFL